MTKTEEFAELYKAGEDDEARALYPAARVHWERIETVAESFGDLDPKMDLREADLEPGQEWTGWHRIEKDLWPARAKGYKPLSDAGRAKYADDLVTNTETLYDKTRDPDLHRRPDRQRLPRPARRGRHRQGHRRGGVLVADRPVGLPGQRRRRPGRLRRAAAAAAAARTRHLDTQIDAKFVALQTLLDAQKAGRRLQALRRAEQAEVKAAVRRGQRPVRAAVQARRRRHLRQCRCHDAIAAEHSRPGPTPAPNRSLAARAGASRPSVEGRVSRRGAARRGRDRRGRSGGRGGRRESALDRQDGQPAATGQPPGARTYPFYGDAPGRHRHARRRTGCTSPPSTSPPALADELVALLQDWTAAAARMTQGQGAGEFGPTSGPYDAPPDDTGEAIGLPPSGLTITFGFGPSLFRSGGQDRFGLADRQPAALQRLPHFPADNLDPTAPTATSASRPAPTTRRSRCTPSATWPGSPSAGPRSAGPSSASGGRRRPRPARPRRGTCSGSRTAR